MVPRGRSQLVESFVWLVPLARIDRLVALSFDSMDRGAWPFFVDGVICFGRHGNEKTADIQARSFMARTLGENGKECQAEGEAKVVT